ncbi:hypothetical protein BRADI_3g26693v3 [Brachypodium distachyon]|uniref:Uncharacterized protein n=1 Tax=Brachypodium distachyon TaxID=15368 RepID=A0A2K2CZC6_BRADI|nr:hypothetical protein BRADI_3g26693v3 [Brachypodium distachyon]
MAVDRSANVAGGARQWMVSDQASFPPTARADAGVDRSAGEQAVEALLFFVLRRAVETARISAVFSLFSGSKQLEHKVDLQVEKAGAQTGASEGKRRALPEMEEGGGAREGRGRALPQMRDGGRPSEGRGKALPEMEEGGGAREGGGRALPQMREGSGRREATACEIPMMMLIPDSCGAHVRSGRVSRALG